MTIGASFIKQFLPITCNQNNYLSRFYTFRKELINSVLINILFFFTINANNNTCEVCLDSRPPGICIICYCVEHNLDKNSIGDRKIRVDVGITAISLRASQ